MRPNHLLSYLRAYARGRQCAHSLPELAAALGQPPAHIAAAAQILAAQGYPILPADDGICIAASSAERRIARRMARRRRRHPLARVHPPPPR